MAGTFVEDTALLEGLRTPTLSTQDASWDPASWYDVGTRAPSARVKAMQDADHAAQALPAVVERAYHRTCATCRRLRREASGLRGWTCSTETALEPVWDEAGAVTLQPRPILSCKDEGGKALYVLEGTPAQAPTHRARPKRRLTLSMAQ